MKKRKKAAKATLSFAMDDEEEGAGDADTPRDSPKPPTSKDEGEPEEDGPPAKRGKFRKNPNVDTSFLPDREREEEERKERERLRLEWLKKQEDIKNEEIEITYSYWDGSGHRKSVTVSRPLLLRTIWFS
jgi:protein FAM50